MSEEDTAHGPFAETGVRGINLHVHPSAIIGASRLLRFSAALQTSGLFERTDIVGQGRPGLPTEELLGPGRRIVRLSGGSARSLTARTKVLRTVGWWLSVLLTYRRANVRVVAAHNVWTLPLCWIISRSTGALMAYNPHELETGTPTMRGLKRCAAVFIERVLAGRARIVTVVNPSIGDWYAEHLGLRAASVLNIPLTPGADSAVDLKSALHVDDNELLFIHTGNLVQGRNIPQIIQAFSDSRTRHHVLFLGAGPLQETVTQAAQRCARIHWMPPVNHADVVSYVRGADAALCLIETQALSYKYSSPNKLFEGLAAARPVFCTDLVEARRLYGAAFNRVLVRCPERDLLRRLMSLDPVSGAERLDDLPRPPKIGRWDVEAAKLVAAYADALDSRRTAP